jgi:CubicO group peptidase (beta-lactamase class C family)
MKQLILVCLMLSITACGGSGSSSEVTLPPDPTPPVDSGPDTTTYPDVEWEVASPADVNMTQSGIDQAMDYAFDASRNTQAVLVIRHGVIVGEQYAEGKTSASLATSWSTGKSFASALIGIAVDQGYIDNIDETAETYLADWVNTGREAVTIRSILEMRSGLAKAEDGDANIYTLGGSNGDQLAVALNRSPETQPRTGNFAYQNADSMLLSGILENATGQNVLDYADTQLFSKIGMTAEWWTDEMGHALTYCCIDTTTRDFARFGLLFARGGLWENDQVISKSWVDESTTAPENTNNPLYALQWWLEPGSNNFLSIGLDSNNIYIYPDLDLVIVRNSLYTREGSSTIRTGGNFHNTLAPETWVHSDFLSPIVESISD